MDDFTCQSSDDRFWVHCKQVTVGRFQPGLGEVFDLDSRLLCFARGDNAWDEWVADMFQAHGINIVRLDAIPTNC